MATMIASSKPKNNNNKNVNFSSSSAVDEVSSSSSSSSSSSTTTTSNEERRNIIQNDIASLTSKKQKQVSSLSSSSSSSSSSVPRVVLPWISVLVWPFMFTMPLVMTSSWSPTSYQQLFPSTWYEYDPLSSDDNNNRPKPLGLILGISAVAIGQIFVWIIFYLYKYGYLSYDRKEPISVQTKGAREYNFYEGIKTHTSQPEGFILLGLYLSGTWLFNLMPITYYNFEGTINWLQVLYCLIIQDGIQYIMHRIEHDISPTFYQFSHKPHHKFINPRLFDAFNGSTIDTICMILIPLYCTANIIHCTNVWTYMAFGSSYANWLTLIHSEYSFPWDNTIFYFLKFGTPADHHVHHAFFKYNFGHLFMWFDIIFGTYKNPNEYIPKLFN